MDSLIRDYWPRATEQDWPLLLQLAQALGMLDAEGNMTDECALWYVVGFKMVPTGETAVDPETGETIEPKEPLADGEGNKLIHANLTTTVDLRARAEALAPGNPTLAEALQEIGRYFVTDENGLAVRPDHPMCVRAGS